MNDLKKQRSKFYQGSIWVLIFSLFMVPFESQAYDLTHSVKKGPYAPLTVALVPFSETRTPQVDRLIDTLQTELKRTKGVRVMDREQTNAILAYYLKYVNLTTEDDSMQRSLTEARQALLEGDYVTAWRLLNQAERRIESRVAQGGSNEGLYQSHLLKAKVARAQGRQADVQKEYDQIILLQPDLEFDPNLYSGWEREALKSSRQKIEALPKSSISVASSPEGSEVFLNGVHQGITPLTLKNLPEGLHVVEVKTVHHSPFLKQVKLTGEKKVAVKASLTRIDTSATEVAHAENTLRPSLYKTDLEVSRLISTLGYHMGVDKIILVADKQAGGVDSVLYRVGDTTLGALQKESKVALSSAHPEAGVLELTSSIRQGIKAKILQDPSKYANQSVGSLKLHEKKRPFYKRPLFWVLVGVGAGAGGALGVILGGGGAAAGGVVIGL